MEHSAWEWLASVLLLPSANDVPVIGVSWTLQHEVLFYAVAATWLVHRGTAMALGALFLGMPLLADLSAFPQSFLFAPLHWEFALGALAHAVHRKVPSWGANVALLAGLGWMVGMEQLAPAADIREDAARVFQYGIGFALICLGAAARQARATSAGPRAYDAFADRLGSWSFALYLVHVPVIQAMVRAADQARWVNADTTHVLAALVLMACLLSGYAYHTWVETPASQWMLRALRARG